ncbi:heparin-sulfate lyase HepC [Dysgonomonas sp. 520]|uniref:heparin-sulfate lyase HepC n=1 Tax=Dysgonomonas sp. 520 TaxID=2302931 RepID=UPI0013D6989E|nr:heparin-sulfate lyase HepC [Dysgonomonas sp. 520]NDW09640.1 heparinase [Dysgonomonas sp. 520]
MNNITKYILIAFCLFVSGTVNAQELNKEALNLVNLDYKGLEKVKALHSEGKDKEAMKELLNYYRSRKDVKHPDIDLTRVRISKGDQKMADEALEHKFFSHKGYQPSYFYGDDIDWTYWPVQDNELRWQLHRHKWFGPMGKAYQVSKDEKYAKEWAFQYMDWIKKNPLLDRKTATSAQRENMRFAWRPLEVSHRLQDQTGQFLYFVKSPHFTPEFLSQFLVNYHKHAQHILANYSDQGNHLLFEAQRVLAAGAFFPELKDASTWRKSGIGVLNEEVDVQVYSDGGQFELDPHYHLAAINIFYKAIQIADVGGFRSEFPKKYLDTVEKMIVFYFNICFPDYSNPCFSDAKATKKEEMVKHYKNWSKVFPDNEQIKYFATEGKKGQLPENLTEAFKTSGFYTFRNSWANDATVMILKAGPPGFWHCQPDNGTFELWIKGRDFFTDSGSYVYAGSEEVNKQRDWFRQTMVHNTLTLDNKNIETADTKCLLWEKKDNAEILVVENPSYKDLKHRRSVFFVDNKFFVVVDQAIGSATGDVAIHYQLCAGKADINHKNFSATTTFGDKNNIILQCFGEKTMTMKDEEGWMSTDYRKKEERPAFAFNVDKKAGQNVRYVTVIYPVADRTSAPKMKAAIKSSATDMSKMNVEVKIGGKTYNLAYKL